MEKLQNIGTKSAIVPLFYCIESQNKITDVECFVKYDSKIDKITFCVVKLLNLWLYQYRCSKNVMVFFLRKIKMLGLIREIEK